jgi:hypothetical protein
MIRSTLFSESEIRFSNLKKEKFQKTILSLKFEIPAHISKQTNLIKFQAHDSFFGIIFLGDLKNESHFLKKKPP